MSLLVYVPNSPETSPLETLKRVGLYELHDEGPACVGAAVNGHGPDGGGGALFGWPGIGEVLAMNLERQEWHALKPHGDLPGGRAWIGWDKSKPPTPETLARKRQLSGEILRLEDGNEWLVPIASQLPKRIGIDEATGRIAGVVAPKYREFFDLAWGVMAKFMDRGDGKIAIEWEEGFPAAVRILAMNYRLTRDLADVLGIIGDQLIWKIPATCCEAVAMADLVQKKRHHESDSIGNGVAG
jgi:hypothetical protein